MKCEHEYLFVEEAFDGLFLVRCKHCGKELFATEDNIIGDPEQMKPDDPVALCNP